ncbi:hypothetical protein HPB47_003123, partial [Ixodes persulcatus]
MVLWLLLVSPLAHISTIGAVVRQTIRTYGGGIKICRSFEFFPRTLANGFKGHHRHTTLRTFCSTVTGRQASHARREVCCDVAVPLLLQTDILLAGSTKTEVLLAPDFVVNVPAILSPEEPALSCAAMILQPPPAPRPCMVAPDVNLQCRSIPDARKTGRTSAQNKPLQERPTCGGRPMDARCATTAGKPTESTVVAPYRQIVLRGFTQTTHSHAT